MQTTYKHNEKEYFIKAYNSNVEIFLGGDRVESIQWDDVCPVSDDGAFIDATEFIEDWKDFYFGDLPAQVAAEAVRFAFYYKIADHL